MKLTLKLTALFLIICSTVNAQAYKKRYREVDVRHYKLNIQVNDSTDIIDANMQVNLRFRRRIETFALDLVSQDSLTGLGMKIDSIYQNNVAVDFTHRNDTINIVPKHPFPGVEYTYTIKYSGIPKDGLVIGTNMHGDRTFFGDNWPNRAHHWFPCIDHPSDKASFETLVTAPNHYQVIANGFMIEETNLEDDLKQYHWKTEVQLPTKVMVIGIAKFAVQNIGETHNIPVSTWVYPQSRKDGFYTFGNAKNILDFFIENVGEYPYKKLANVQSKTRYGGMENAGNIFYFEKSASGERNRENLIAHEIAHQWFGNSASEIDWAHTWLSEGFATYMTNLFILDSKGVEAFKKQMEEDRNSVLKFYKRSPTPIVQPDKATDYSKILSANTYQKGGWVLHMLRKQIGDETFRKGIKQYYEQYKFSNASSEDFRDVMAKVSGQNLDKFFEQWLYKAGQPKLKTDWIFHNNKIRIIVEQLQETAFEFPLDIELTYKDGSKEVKTIEVFAKSAPYVVETSAEVKDIKLDPNVWLLHDTTE